MAFRGPRVWLWRWRRNPLKRRSDTVEAWVVLGAWVLTVVCGVLAGWTAARSVEQGLARERAEWRPVAGRLTERAPGKATAPAGERVWAEAGWTGPDGSARTGQVRVAPGSGVGTTVTVWTDRRGRLVTEPATAAQARVRGWLVGGLAGVTVGVLPCAGGGYLRGRLERRRIERWAVEWALFDAVRGRPAG
ncbi:hypothetical protein [Streptomyces sp. NPDC048737]|uniref:Rv1733c family protein n=1 Tax=unclassified Streptomyces TaxID=2593676 RepID=UPI00342338F6